MLLLLLLAALLIEDAVAVTTITTTINLWRTILSQSSYTSDPGTNLAYIWGLCVGLIFASWIPGRRVTTD